MKFKTNNFISRAGLITTYEVPWEGDSLPSDSEWVRVVQIEVVTTLVLYYAYYVNHMCTCRATVNMYMCLYT